MAWTSLSEIYEEDSVFWANELNGLFAPTNEKTDIVKECRCCGAPKKYNEDCKYCG
jgi:hypothetical protein